MSPVFFLDEYPANALKDEDGEAQAPRPPGRDHQSWGPGWHGRTGSQQLHCKNSGRTFSFDRDRWYRVLPLCGGTIQLTGRTLPFLFLFIAEPDISW